MAAGAFLYRYPLTREETPWAELARDGTFSKATLERHPTSFMVAPEWTAVLNKSAGTAAATWLHDYHLAVATLDSIDRPDDQVTIHIVSRRLVTSDAGHLSQAFNASAALFASSLAKRESAEALRGLAIIDSARGLFSLAHARYIEMAGHILSRRGWLRDGGHFSQRYMRALQLATDPADPDPEGLPGASQLQSGSETAARTCLRAACGLPAGPGLHAAGASAAL